jgi:hypothetical protein
MELNYTNLTARRQQMKDDKKLTSAVNLRVHRALSWLNAADQSESLDTKFIFLWIAFNAAYAKKIQESTPSGVLDDVHEFITTLVSLDKDELLLERVFCDLTEQIMPLVQNKYASHHFWSCRDGFLTEKEAEKKFVGSCSAVQRAMDNKDPEPIIRILFQRCYTVRNQIVHGGATWESKANRETVAQCVKIMSILLPVFIHLVLENPEEEWGDPYYPLVADKKSWMDIK